MIKGNPIKIKGAITFLVNPGDTTIRIEDKNSGLLIMEISLTDDQLVKALSRLANTPFDRVKLFVKSLKFCHCTFCREHIVSCAINGVADNLGELSSRSESFLEEYANSI